jgi:tripartite-type tricarboxylate transporter receptor subunit TctC
MTAELGKVLRQPEVQRRFEEQGVSAGDLTPQQLAVFIRAETAKWAQVTKDSGVVPE